MRFIKVPVSKFTRRLGLISVLDKLLFVTQLIANYPSNRRFRRANPEVSIPPCYMVYESFRLNYQRYYFGGKETATEIASYADKLIAAGNRKILEWGCGPGRILRHLPGIMDPSDSFYGTDINIKTINWCSENLKGISFRHNSIHALLPFESNFFDLIFGISVLTHLSADLQKEWIRELSRVLKKDGILILTTQSNAYRQKLSKSEKKEFDRGQLVVREKADIGHRTYSAFQPVNFMMEICSGLRIVEHIEPITGKGHRFHQDFWILRK